MHLLASYAQLVKRDKRIKANDMLRWLLSKFAPKEKHFQLSPNYKQEIDWLLDAFSESGLISFQKQVPAKQSLLNHWKFCFDAIKRLLKKHDDPDRVNRYFEVPEDYLYFMRNYGGKPTIDGYDFYEAKQIVEFLREDISLNFSIQEHGESSSEVSVVDGYWMRIGGPDWKFDHFLCCDKSHPNFGTYTRGDDSHPQWGGYSVRHQCFFDLLANLAPHHGDHSHWKADTYEENLKQLKLKYTLLLRCHKFRDIWHYLDKVGFESVANFAKVVNRDWIDRSEFYESLIASCESYDSEKQKLAFRVALADQLNVNRSTIVYWDAERSGTPSEAVFSKVRTELTYLFRHLNWYESALVEIEEYLTENQHHFQTAFHLSDPWLEEIVNSVAN